MSIDAQDVPVGYSHAVLFECSCDACSQKQICCDDYTQDPRISLEQPVSNSVAQHPCARNPLPGYQPTNQPTNQISNAPPSYPAGRQYLRWLADARTALELGTANFIARDYDNLAELLDPVRLAPLITQVDPLELLGQHHWR